MNFCILVCCFIWLFKSTSLPNLYHTYSRRKQIPVKDFRQLEKCVEKVAKLKLDNIYFQNCLDLGIFPKFLKIKTPKLKVYQDLKTIHREILRKQMEEVKKEIKCVTNKMNKMRESMKSKLSFMEFAVLLSHLSRYIKKKTEDTVKIHQKKLVALWKSQRNPSPECLINKSKKKLSVHEEEALRYGLKHHVPPPKVDEMDIKAKMEKHVDDLEMATGNEDGVPGKLHNDILETIRHSTQTFINASKQICKQRFNMTLHKVLGNLKKDTSIKVCKFDKGNGTVILDSDDYFKKLDKIVLDKTKFKEIDTKKTKTHPVINKENTIKRFLSKCIKKFVSPKEYSKLVPSGSQPGKIYGLCKVHKEGEPLRPVVSMLGTAEYNIAKYLDNIIKPCIPSNYMLNSTKGFIETIKSFVFNIQHIVVSYDVVSLFTNIPLKETIDIVTDYVYNSENSPKFEKKDFKKLLEIATGGYFLYQNKLYCQIDGVTMGSPLGPTLANFFLAHFENKFMSENLEFLPEKFVRYVDDVFCVFSSMDYVNKFLDYLNHLHPNLKFTHELGPRKLAFLDTEIDLDLNSGNFGSQVYRKPTNTNVILNWTAYCPENWKLGLITCLINRAYIVCSTWDLFNNEMGKLKDIFKKNGYPNGIFNWCLNKFLDKKLNG